MRTPSVQLPPTHPLLPQDLLTPTQAAKRLRIHVSTIYRWIANKRLRGYRIATCRYWVSLADLARVVEVVGEGRG